MSIKFYCSCGKRLKAKDDMAARRTICPGCGNPVGVPSLQPTQRGTSAAPLTPFERLQRERQRLDQTAPAGKASPETAVDASSPATSLRSAALAGNSAAALPRPEPAVSLSSYLDPERLDLPLEKTGMLFRVVPMKLKRKRTWQAWPLETRWHESVFYPLLAFPLVLGLALLFTLMSGLGALFWHTLPEFQAAEPNLWWVPWLFFPALVIGYTCGFFRCVLASALAGEAGGIRWPGYDLLLVLRSSLFSLLAAAEGPVLLVTIAYYFWLEGGDPTIVDWAILWELLIAAAAHFILLFLAVCMSNRLLDANPARLVQLVHELGWRGRIIVLAGAVVLVGNGLLIVEAVGSLQPSSGWMTLFGWWTCGFYLLTLFFRWLGVFCHYHFRLERQNG